MKPILAIAKGDLISTFRNGQNIFFGIAFPMIFILVFGFLGSGGPSYELAIRASSEVDNPVYQAIREVDFLDVTTDLSDDEISEQLKKGEIVGALNISSNNDKISVNLETTAAEPEAGSLIRSTLSSIIDPVNLQLSGITEPPITLNINEVEGREFKQIDFILPGMLGFALLNSGIFATAFLFVSLRDTLVLKRFSATPIKQRDFIIGLAISKVAFAMIQAVVIILSGYFFFGFTLINGFGTLMLLLLFAMMGIIIFLGFGFIVSSYSKDQNSVPPIANIITMPQFLLAGTFFPIEAFPEWLQPIGKVMPLRFFNEAMRSISFDGVGLTGLGTELLGITIWGIAVYIIAIKTFKWGNR